MATVLLVGTLDTKGAELDCLRGLPGFREIEPGGLPTLTRG